MQKKDKIIKTDEWEVLTPSGWSDFSGIKKTIKIGGFYIEAALVEHQDKKFTLLCSKNHKLKRLNGEFVTATDVAVGDWLSGQLEIIKKEPLPEIEQELYDLLDVEKDNEYYTNGIVSHNCAHIPENLIVDLWLSIFPTISAGGSMFVISTPTNDQTLFYRLWTDAEEGKNEFKPIKLLWDVHPERDQTWFDRESAITRAAKGEIGVLQEYFCSFGTSGDTFINTELLISLEKNSVAPLRRHPSHMEILIWKEPEPGANYLITADISSGTAEDYSTFCVLNLGTGEVVADFKAKIPPQELAPLLMEIGYWYNTAVLCPELNSYGLIVSNELIKESNNINGIKGKYPNLFFEKQETLALCFKEPFYKAELNELPGFTTSVTTRPEILAKLDFMLSTGKLQINSSRFVAELKSFKWKKNKPQAEKGKNDDLVLAYSIAAYLFYTLDAELQPNENKEKPLLESSTLLAMLGGLGVKNSTLDMASKQIVLEQEQFMQQVTEIPKLVNSNGEEISTGNSEEQQPKQPHRNPLWWIY